MTPRQMTPEDERRERLRAHVVESVRKSGSGAVLVSAAGVAELFDTLDTLAQRVEAAEKDAARYRLLRSIAVEGRMESRGPRPDFALNCDEPDAEWDAAIDALPAPPESTEGRSE